jgi:hypothetical protein
MRKSLFHAMFMLGALIPFLFQAAAANAQNNSQWWTTVGSAGSVDLADLSNVTFHGPEAIARPRTSALIRYNVTPVPPIDVSFGCLALRVRYRDEFNQPPFVSGKLNPIYSPDSVAVVLNQENVFSGQTNILAQLKSDTFPAKGGYQVQTSAPLAGGVRSLDFSSNAYWVEVSLQNNPHRQSGSPVVIGVFPPGESPAVSAVQIVGSCQIN